MPEGGSRSIETHLRAAVESAPSGLLMADADGRIVLVNREIERLFGYAREELLGQPIERLVPERFRGVHPGYRAGFRMDPRVRSMGAGRDLFGLRKDGVEVPVEIGLTPVPTEDGLYVLGAIVDISARKRHEEEQRVLSEQLRQAQKMEAVGTLAGGVAHDFNHLLGAIVGYAELIGHEVSDRPNVLRDIDELLAAAMRGRRLVERILAFSRRQEPQRRPIALADVITEIQQLLRATLPASIELRVEVPAGLPRILADNTSVHQVLMNLTSNSAHAMTQGGRLVIKAAPLYVRDSVARANPGLREGQYLALEVRDSGRGMDPTTRGRAFEPFFTTKGPGEGTGLGLAMVHGIMHDHHGSVQLESEAGVGTVVRCLFPAVDEGTVASAVGTATVSVREGRGECILFVDDEPSLLTVGKRRLERTGYSVVVTESPREALRILADPDRRVDLLITDYSMPEMNGLALGRAAVAARPNLPVILLTGFIDELDEAVLAASGVRTVLRKPVLTEELTLACAAMLPAPT
jgi:PAS domain S-box-containing protein